MTKVVVQNGGWGNLSVTTKESTNLFACPGDKVPGIITGFTRSFSRVLFLADQTITSGYGDLRRLWEADQRQPDRRSRQDVHGPGMAYLDNIRGNNWYSFMPFNYFRDLDNPVLQSMQNIPWTWVNSRRTERFPFLLTACGIAG